MAGDVVVRHRRQVDLEDSEEAAAAGQLLPSDWNGDDAHEVVGAAPIDSPDFLNEPTAPTPPTADTSRRLATMEAVHAVVEMGVSKVVKVITAAGPYAAMPGDDVLIVNQVAAAPFTVTVDWSARTKPLRVVDGKGDALLNPIGITSSLGQSQLAVVNNTVFIPGNGGSIILTPLPDGTGAY